jgi:hypothetical protein
MIVPIGIKTGWPTEIFPHGKTGGAAFSRRVWRAL